MLFRKPNIENTIAQWEKDFNLSHELKFILKICMNWLYQQGYNHHDLIKDVILQHLHPLDDKDHVRPWINNNIEAIINVFYDQKRFDVNTYHLLDAMLITKSIIDDKGVRHRWHPYKVNYQVAIYLEKAPFNEISLQQLNHFTTQIGYKPICYNVIHTSLSSIIDYSHLPHQTCPYGKHHIDYSDPINPIMLIDEIAHVPCIVFGGHKLNLSSDCHFKVYPSYRDIEDAIREMSASLMATSKEIEYELDETCLIQ